MQGLVTSAYVVLVALGAAPAPAASALVIPPQLQALLDDAEYQRARKQVDRLLRNQKLAAADRVVLYAAHAECDVSLGDDAAAEQSFQKLLTLQPDYRADATRTPPKVLEVYALVRSRMQEQGALESAYGAEFQPLADVATGEEIPVRVAFKSPAAAGIERVFIRFRRVGQPGFESAELAAAAGPIKEFQGAIPKEALASDEEEFAVDYLLDALGADGARLTGVGTLQLPLQFRVSRPDVLAAGIRAGQQSSGETARKVAVVVVPLVIGGAVVLVVASVTAVILGLTALDPGASHLFIRRFQ